MLTQPAGHSLAALNVFVLEDEMVIAMEMEFALREAGAKNVELCFRLTETSHLRAAEADAAVIDLDIGGVSSVATAHHLIARGVPFIIATAMHDDEIDPSLSRILRVRKPFSTSEFVSTLRAAIDGRERCGS